MGTEAECMQRKQVWVAVDGSQDQSTKAEQEASNTTGAGNRGMQRESWVQVTVYTEDIMDTGNRGTQGHFWGPM